MLGVKNRSFPVWFLNIKSKSDCNHSSRGHPDAFHGLPPAPTGVRAQQVELHTEHRNFEARTRLRRMHQPGPDSGITRREKQACPKLRRSATHARWPCYHDVVRRRARPFSDQSKPTRRRSAKDAFRGAHVRYRQIGQVFGRARCFLSFSNTSMHSETHAKAGCTERGR